MSSPEFVVLCSSLPGFIRSVGSQLAGKCRLLECYSLTEASQLIQVHQPALVVIDLTRATQQQIDRTWAMAQNSRTTSVVVATDNQLTSSDVPEELICRVAVVDVGSASESSEQVAAVALEMLAGERSHTIASQMQLDDEAPRRSSAAEGPDHIPGNRSQYASGRQTQPTSTTPHDTGKGRTVAHPAAASHNTAAGLNSVAAPTGISHSARSAEGSGRQSMADRYRTQTPALRQMLQRLEVAARHDVTILLIGETGSGKTHLARLIHEVSNRSESPFLTVACGALPAELIESELFGHVKGAFTSAHTDKDGKFLAAGKGTILLDEIDVLSPEQQVKLLRVIEKGEFEPVGSNVTHQVQARIIAASNLELQPLVEEGRFRPDLYYRLNTLCFQIPPLRKRLPDIEPLARYFVHLHAQKHGIEVVDISDDFLETLLRYPWPGNVREMENAVRSAVIYCEKGRLTLDTLPPNIVQGTAGPANDPSVAGFFSSRRGDSLGSRVQFTERDIIEQALLNNSFSRTRTAKELGISRVTLYNKMKKYGMMPEN